jgi:TRAP-type C4-dicarboxylate transport system substrate-binding protein
VMSTQSFSKIPEKHRDAVLKAVNARAKEFAAAEVTNGEQSFLQSLKDQGMTVVEVDKAAFRNKVSSVVDKDFASLKPLYQKIVAEGTGASN